LLLSSGFLPSRDVQQPSVTVPIAISQLMPLPQEILLNSYSRGQSELVSGRFLEAVENFNIAAEAASSPSPDVYTSRGIAEEKLFRWDDAIADYKKSMQIIKRRFPFMSDATVLSNLANAESGRGGIGDFELALRDFTLAANLDKSFVAPKIGRGLMLYELSDSKDTNSGEAKKIFQELLQQYPTYPDFLAAIACIVYHESGPTAEVRSNFQKAIVGDPRYRDKMWVETVRRWPPRLVSVLSDLLDDPEILSRKQ